MPQSARDGKILQKTEKKACYSEENGILDSAVSSEAFILPVAHLQAGMLQTDGEARRSQHTCVSCGLILICQLKKSREICLEARWEVLVKPQFSSLLGVIAFSSF